MKVWHPYEINNQYYYDNDDGLIIGQVHKFGTSIAIYTASVIFENVERTLGRYITIEYAMKAVEKFWSMQERTLEYTDA